MLLIWLACGCLVLAGALRLEVPLDGVESKCAWQ